MNGAAAVYRHLAERLRREVESGRFAQVERLPGERELAPFFVVSRTTLRRAISALVGEGLLFHRQGAGAFIRRAAPRVEAPISRLTGFSEDMAMRGLRAGTRELASGVFLPAPEAIGPSLYETLKARGFGPARGLQRLRAALLPDADADLLAVPKGSPTLYIQRIAYLSDGRCVEFPRSYYRADTYDFVSELTLAPQSRRSKP